MIDTIVICVACFSLGLMVGIGPSLKDRYRRRGAVAVFSDIERFINSLTRVKMSLPEWRMTASLLGIAGADLWKKVHSQSGHMDEAEFGESISKEWEEKAQEI